MKYEKVFESVSRIFGIHKNDITADMTPNDIPKWDSLGQLALICAIETDYSITLELEEIFEIMSIGDIFTILERRNIK